MTGAIALPDPDNAEEKPLEAPVLVEDTPLFELPDREPPNTDAPRARTETGAGGTLRDQLPQTPAEAARLLFRTPFTDLHLAAGGDGQRGEHVVRGRICFAADFGVRAIGILLVFALIAAVGYKVFLA